MNGVTESEKQQIAEWSKDVDALAKQMRPTRNGEITMVQFMAAVKTMFEHKGYDFPLYCEVGMQNFMSTQSQKNPTHYKSKEASILPST